MKWRKLIHWLIDLFFGKYLWQRRKNRLIDLLRRKSFKFSIDPPFTLVSGRKSPYFFNCKLTYLDPEGKELIGRMMHQAVKGKGIEAIGGMELGSVPISGAVSLISRLMGESIADFIVRKTIKNHGDISGIEGEIKFGMRVAVIDDVITTGGSTIAAIEAVEAAGAVVVFVGVIVDRQEGGREKIQERLPGVDIVALTLKEELLSELQKQAIAKFSAVIEPAAAAAQR